AAPLSPDADESSASSRSRGRAIAEAPVAQEMASIVAVAARSPRRSGGRSSRHPPPCRRGGCRGGPRRSRGTPRSRVLSPRRPPPSPPLLRVEAPPADLGSRQRPHGPVVRGAAQNLKK